jgi:hypothetical protein
MWFASRQTKFGFSTELPVFLAVNHFGPSTWNILLASLAKNNSRSCRNGTRSNVIETANVSTSRRLDMKYMLLVYGDEKAAQNVPKAELGKVVAAYGAYSEALRKAGVSVTADRLQATSSATTVRIVDGKTRILDGPYADTKEQLGGFYIIDAKNLDEALSWAERCPATAHGGSVEVRPIFTM